MDFIDSDEDDEQTSSSSTAPDHQALTNAFFVCCMRIKPFLKATKSVHYNTRPNEATSSSMLWNHTDVILHRHLLLLCLPEDREVTDLLVSRLRQGKFQHIDVRTAHDIDTNATTKYDAVVVLSATMDVHVVQAVCDRQLVAGGSLLVHVESENSVATRFDPYHWVSEEQHVQRDGGKGEGVIVMLRKRAVLCNEIGAIYWTRNTQRLPEERRLLELVSVPLSVAEKNAGVLSDASHAKGVHTMLEYGVCIFPGMFDREESKEWGRKAMEDMKLLLGVLQAKKNIDLLHPETVDGKHVKVDNFHELSMREALRCDIRNVPNLKEKLDSLEYINTNEWPSYAKVHDKMSARNPTPLNIPPSKNVRFHPALLSVLHDSMNPAAPTPGDELGNWGRWNFEGPGPEAPNPIRVGKPGFIFSFPGCSDQTIHADAPHIFVHEQLPPHYINLFIATHENARSLTKELLVDETKPRENNVLRGFPVTMTSFVVGSQKLKLSAKIMNQVGGQEELEARLVRPQLDVGDALLFDCRVLHFGLANESDIKSEKGEEVKTDAWRPMMYVNYHHTWFHDPKNWNDAEKIIS